MRVCVYVCVCRFRRPVNGSRTAPESMVLSEDWYVLLAVGALSTSQDNSDEGGVTYMMKHEESAVSDCPCDVMSCCEACYCSSAFSLRLLKLHGKRESSGMGKSSFKLGYVGGWGG